MKSVSRGKKRRQADVVLGAVPHIIARIPRPYPPSPEDLGALITEQLVNIWTGILSDKELRELQGKNPATATTFDKLDALILKQAETMGWRLGLSSLVHLRFCDWDFQPDGPNLFERYGKALAKSARCFQKKRPVPIDDPDLYRHKREAVPELRLFLQNLRSAFSRRRTGPSFDELIEYFEGTVSAQGDAFVHLRANLNSWTQYFRANPTSIKLLLHGKRISPATLFDSWCAWGKGLEPETIRQKISELGRLFRDSRNS
jgi:hypothetical protein